MRGSCASRSAGLETHVAAAMECYYLGPVLPTELHDNEDQIQSPGN